MGELGELDEEMRTLLPYLRTSPLLHALSILLARLHLLCHYSPSHQGQNPTFTRPPGIYGLTELAVIDTKTLIPQDAGPKFIDVMQ